MNIDFHQNDLTKFGITSLTKARKHIVQSTKNTQYTFTSTNNQQQLDNQKNEKFWNRWAQWAPKFKNI